MDSPDPELGKNPGRAGTHVPGQDAGVTKNAGMPRVNSRGCRTKQLVRSSFRKTKRSRSAFGHFMD